MSEGICADPGADRRASAPAAVFFGAPIDRGRFPTFFW
jgi:hypothetical protein